MNINPDLIKNVINVDTSINDKSRVNVLHSSNLWHYNTTKTTNGVTSTYENSTITLNGTAIGSGYNVPINSAMLHLNAGNYALKLTEISGTKPRGQSLIIRNVTSGTNLVDTDFSTTNTYTFTLSSNADIAVMVYFWNNNVFDNYKFGVQLQEGSKTDAYKPYVAPSIVVDGETIYTKGQLEVLPYGTNIDTLLDDYSNHTYAIFNATGTLPPGYDTSNNNIIITTLLWSNDWGRQICQDIRTKRTSIRNILNGVWKHWVEIENEYSTNERVIGTWIDGKPIYRKVVNTTSPSEETGTLYNASSLNIDNITNMYCVISTVSFDIRVKVKLPYYYNDNDAGTIWLEGNNINLRLTGSTYRGQSTILFLEYTKTTD